MSVTFSPNDELTVEMRPITDNEPGYSNRYRFTTQYEYIEYSCVVSFKFLEIIEDFRDYFTEMEHNIKIVISEKRIVLKLPVPYSSKEEVVELMQEQQTDQQLLEIKIRKQHDQIASLTKEIQTLKTEMMLEKSTEIRLALSADNGYFFDEKAFLSEPYANEDNLKLFYSMMDDHFGFGTQAYKEMDTGRCAFGINHFFNNIDELLDGMNREVPIKIHSGNAFVTIANFYIEDIMTYLFPIDKKDSSSIERNISYNIIRNTGYEEVDRANRYLHQYKKIARDAGGIVSIFRYSIPNKTIQYKKFPGIYIDGRFATDPAAQEYLYAMNAKDYKRRNYIIIIRCESYVITE